VYIGVVAVLSKVATAPCQVMSSAEVNWTDFRATGSSSIVLLELFALSAPVGLPAVESKA